MGRRCVQVSSDELALAGGSSHRPHLALYVRPRARAHTYGFARSDRVKCQNENRRGRQCAFYACESVAGLPCCRLHAIIRRGGKVAGPPRAEQAELRLRPRRR